MLELTELNYIFHPKTKLKNIETIFKFGVCAKAENNYHAGWPATLPTLANMQFQKATFKYYYNLINGDKNIKSKFFHFRNTF